MKENGKRRKKVRKKKKMEKIVRKTKHLEEYFAAEIV